jgi:hypothetical protein
MSTPLVASGLLGAHATSFPSVLREGTDRHPVTAVTLTIPVSHDDVEAVFWWLIHQGVQFTELADPATAVFYLCDALAHERTHTFEEARHTVGALAPGTVEHGRYLRVRALVDDLIGSRMPAQARRRAPRRTTRSAAAAVSVERVEVAAR